MSLVTTPSVPSVSILSNDLAENGPISIYSTPMNGRKASIDGDSPSSSATNSPASSTVQLNSIASSNSSTAASQPKKTSNGVRSKRSGHNAGPMAILTPCSNSHPFEERRILVTRDEERAVKFGRAVARFQPAQNNAIFDCKVLSRNHAILWYEGDQFYIKDTRSSNGTFVNNQRLSSSGEESAPRVLHSGDILQLGVDIIDHAKNVACGCTICIVRLIDERGEECVGNEEIALNERLPLNFMERLPINCTLITHEKLFKLSQYMKEAQYREQLFTDRLRNLESVLLTTQEAAESGWQALINEERLLSRIESLENQLALYKSKAPSSEDFQEEMRQLLEDRNKAEMAAKESLKKAEDQIYEANMKVHDMERLLISMDENNQSLERRNAELEEENQRQAGDYEKLLQSYNEVSKEMVGLKESLAVAKKTASTFSVTRIEKKEDSPVESKSEATTCTTCPDAPKPLFYQEAQTQTDEKKQEVVEEEKQIPVVEEKIIDVRNYNLEAQILLMTLFPLLLILLIGWPWPFGRRSFETVETTKTSVETEKKKD